MKKLLLIFLFIFSFLILFSQNQKDSLVYKKYYYTNGNISSEGYMLKNQPEGYWKTYNEKGILITEGNRKNFKLDSIWKFYNQDGKLQLEITYEEGKKNGIRREYHEQEIVEYYFHNDVIDSLKIYYPNKKLKIFTPYEDGIENGFSKEYDTSGTVIVLREYRGGVAVSLDRINRYDKAGMKTGMWKTFFPNGLVYEEIPYQSNKRNGFYKVYDTVGNLSKIEKYVNDELIQDPPELRKLEIRTDYYPNGNPKIVAGYYKGKAEGVRREYSEDGKIKKSYILHEGRVIGEGGIVDDKGFKNGHWKEYYDDGALKSEGKYVAGRKVDYWKYYFKNGEIEQEGNFGTKGEFDGVWKWYYETGKERLVENYENGLLEGAVNEYDEKGNIIVKGEYLGGEENGNWLYKNGSSQQTGNYINGRRNGLWKHYLNDILIFEGAFLDGIPNGKHKYYWETGKIKEEINYVQGKKQGEDRKYDREGNIFLIITYKNGMEISYDSYKLPEEMLVGEEGGE